MRILLIHPYGWPAMRSRAERYLHDLNWYLRSRGHHVDLVTGRDPDGNQESTNLGLRAFPQLWKRRRRYDVVHATTPTAAIASVAAGHRTVYTLSFHPERGTLPSRPIKRRLLTSAVRRAHLVTAWSPQSAAEAKVAFRVEPVVLPPGIRIDRFPLNARPRGEPPRIFFTDALDQPHTGLATLLMAFGRVRETHPEAELHLSGPGDPREMLRTLGDQHNATLRQVHFLAVGTRAGAAEHYRFAHVTASPAKHEPFGLVLIESLACGTPVVGATPGGMASIVNGDTIGRLAACDDARAIAAAILHCIDLSRRPETPGRCREHAQRWDWETSVGPAHEALYAEAASRTNARR